MAAFSKMGEKALFPSHWEEVGFEDVCMQFEAADDNTN